MTGIPSRRHTSAPWAADAGEAFYRFLHGDEGLGCALVPFVRCWCRYRGTVLYSTVRMRCTAVYTLELAARAARPVKVLILADWEIGAVGDWGGWGLEFGVCGV